MYTVLGVGNKTNFILYDLKNARQAFITNDNWKGSRVTYVFLEYKGSMWLHTMYNTREQGLDLQSLPNLVRGREGYRNEKLSDLSSTAVKRWMHHEMRSIEHSWTCESLAQDAASMFGLYEFDLDGNGAVLYDSILDEVYVWAQEVLDAYMQPD